MRREFQLQAQYRKSSFVRDPWLGAQRQAINVDEWFMTLYRMQQAKNPIIWPTCLDTQTDRKWVRFDLTAR